MQIYWLYILGKRGIYWIVFLGKKKLSWERGQRRKKEFVTEKSVAFRASQGALVVKNRLPCRRDAVQSLSQEGPLEEGMATRSSILAWRIPWTGEPGRLGSKGLKRVGHDWVTNTFTSTKSSTSYEKKL